MSVMNIRENNLHIDDLCKCQTLDSLTRFSTLRWAKGRRMWGSLSAGRGGLCREQESPLLPSSKSALFRLLAAKRVVASSGAQGWKDFTLYLRGREVSCHAGVMRSFSSINWLWKQAPSAVVLIMRITNEAAVRVTFCVTWLISFILWQYVGH